MRGEILGLERRHRRSAGEKLSIGMAVGVDGATVTQVAQQHEITRQQIYAWRHALKRKGVWPAKDGSARLTSTQLAMLWEGVDWRRPNWGAPPARVG
jgi:transposase-like protein